MNITKRAGHGSHVRRTAAGKRKDLFTNRKVLKSNHAKNQIESNRHALKSNLLQLKSNRGSSQIAI